MERFEGVPFDSLGERGVCGCQAWSLKVWDDNLGEAVGFLRVVGQHVSDPVDPYLIDLADRLERWNRSDSGARDRDGDCVWCLVWHQASLAAERWVRNDPFMVAVSGDSINARTLMVSVAVNLAISESETAM